MPKGLDEELEKIDNLGDEQLEPINSGAERQEGADTIVVEGNEGGDEGEGAKKVTKSTELSEEKVAEITARMLERVERTRQQNNPRKEPELTKEQITKLLNPVVINKDFLTKHGLLSPDDDDAKIKAKVSLYQELSDMQTKHHTSLMQVMMENMQRNMQQQAAPLFDFYQRQAAERDKNAFFGQYKELKKFEKFVQFAASTIQPTNADGSEKSVKGVMAEIAKATKDLLKESGVDVDNLTQEEGQEAATNHGAPADRNDVPRMSRMSGGGRSGAPAAKGGGNNPDADIYQ